MLDLSHPHALGSFLFLASLVVGSGWLEKRLRSLQLQSKHGIASSSSAAVSSKAQALLPGPVSTTERVAYWEGRDEENRWLEEVEGVEALGWVVQQNTRTVDHFGEPKNDPLYSKILSILDSKEKIPHVGKIGEHYYNYWMDEVNPRGIWRRTSLASYSSDSTEWEVLLDLDALGLAEGESWVWAGQSTYFPEDLAELPTRTLIYLSRGGADARVVREFDLITKSFVSVEAGGFCLMESQKCRMSWLDRDTLLAGTQVDGVVAGAVNSMTDSGYPRLVCEWRRGTPLSAATVAFEGEASDVSVSGYVSTHGGCRVEWRSRALTFYTSRRWVRLEQEQDWHELALQPDAVVSVFSDQLLITLRSNWSFNNEEYVSGSVLAVNLRAFLHTKRPKVVVLFAPSARVALDDTVSTKNFLCVHTLENVRSRVHLWQYQRPSAAEEGTAGGWVLVGSEDAAAVRGLSLGADDDDRNDLLWVTKSSFLTPSSLYLVDISAGLGALASLGAPIRSLPTQFDASGLEESQGEATSKDGEIIPYFLIRKKGAAPVNHKTPCLLYGYGGFEISMLPYYLVSFGAAWLEQGYSYVIANIRGGGEFGPEWHKAALKENRNKAYEDFIAVAEQLIASGIATSSSLGIRGGSNGGLLMGNMYVLRPDLFGAVVCEVPLLDMKRYNKLLAGASWMAEYGNPDTPDWEYLKAYSAYHNFDASGKAEYPQLLLTTSMKDDRVHPYHARSFARRAAGLPGAGEGNKVWYYENIEGGHAGAADSKQRAYASVLYIRFLEKYLKK